MWDMAAVDSTCITSSTAQYWLTCELAWTPSVWTWERLESSPSCRLPRDTCSSRATPDERSGFVLSYLGRFGRRYCRTGSRPLTGVDQCRHVVWRSSRHPEISGTCL